MEDNNQPIWVDELIEENTSLVPQTEENQDLMVLSEEDKQKIINEEAPEEHKGVLNALIELNQTANVLAKIDSEEQVEQRNRVLNMVMEGFVQKRYMSNLKLEDLKEKLIQSVTDNIDNLDLLTQIDTLEKIHNITQVDAQKAGGQGMGNGMGMVPSGVNITLNNASGNGTVEATQNTLNVNNGITAENLKEVASLNATMKSMKDSGAPRKVNTVDVEAEEKKE